MFDKIDILKFELHAKCPLHWTVANQNEFRPTALSVQTPIRNSYKSVA